MTLNRGLLNILKNICLKGNLIRSRCLNCSSASEPFENYDVIRVFLWARNRVEGGKDPGAFVIATCELAGHVLIYDKEEYDKMDWHRVADAQKESCDKTFNEIKQDVIQMLATLSTSKLKTRDDL